MCMYKEVEVNRSELVSNFPYEWKPLWKSITGVFHCFDKIRKSANALHDGHPLINQTTFLFLEWRQEQHTVTAKRKPDFNLLKYLTTSMRFWKTEITSASGSSTISDFKTCYDNSAIKSNTALKLHFNDNYRENLTLSDG